MRRNLLVKGEGTLLGRKTSLCQDTKHYGVLKHCFQDVKEGAISRAKKRVTPKDEWVFRRQLGRTQLWGDSEWP